MQEPSETNPTAATILQEARRRSLINMSAAGVEVRALSSDSIREVTECVLEMGQNAIKLLLECGKDSSLEEEYFDNSFKMLDFCAALGSCTNAITEKCKRILQQLKVGEVALEELKKFKDVKHPFTEEFVTVSRSVYGKQTVLFRKLQLRKVEFDEKLKQINLWKNVYRIIFAATLGGVMFSTVVAAVMEAPPLATALTGAASVPLGSMGKWIDTLMENYGNAVKAQKEIINCTTVSTNITISDLDNIQALIDRLEIEIKALARKVDFAINEAAVEITRDEIELFLKNVEGLRVKADRCSRYARSARVMILERIIKPLLEFDL